MWLVVYKCKSFLKEIQKVRIVPGKHKSMGEMKHCSLYKCNTNNMKRKMYYKSSWNNSGNWDSGAKSRSYTIKLYIWLRGVTNETVPVLTLDWHMTLFAFLNDFYDRMRKTVCKGPLWSEVSLSEDGVWGSSTYSQASWALREKHL